MNHKPPCSHCSLPPLVNNRRGFLAAGSIAVSTVLLKNLFPDRVLAQDAERPAMLADYPRLRIASLKTLEVDKPIRFAYPEGAKHSAAMLVKLGKQAGGGAGDDQDIVAYSTLCTHMGGDLSGEYNAEYKVAGPCREHLTTFDLTRHGMVVSGHATQALPQIVLEIDGDDVIAVGILGLLYGYHQPPISA